MLGGIRVITKGNSFSLEQYRKEGYSGPTQGLTLKEADMYYDKFFSVLGQSKYTPGPANIALSAWHHRFRWAYELATHLSIINSMREILGEDLILWAMHFWYKEPGNGKYIPWHQDINYWPMNPAINATAWVSLGWSIQENGCLLVIPGSHSSHLKHVPTGDETSSFSEEISSDLIDESQAVALEMSPGQIAFFDETTIHGSKINDSSISRVAFSVRYTTPDVKFKIQEWGGDKQRIKTFLISGQDRYHYNDAIVGEVPEQ